MHWHLCLEQRVCLRLLSSKLVDIATNLFEKTSDILVTIRRACPFGSSVTGTAILENWPMCFRENLSIPKNLLISLTLEGRFIFCTASMLKEVGSISFTGIGMADKFSCLLTYVITFGQI